MRTFRKLALGVIALLFVFAGQVVADKPGDEPARKARQAKRLAQAGDALSKSTGACVLGSSFQDLDVNNVRARLYNTGGLFYRDTELYEVPKGSGSNAIFASGIWMGGLVDGDLRMIGATYANWELWPGPLDDNGNPPADCSVYDRMYKVSKSDIQEYEDSGVPTPDLADWPGDLGAPVVDGDGNPNNYNLAGGDRPDILGDQTVWWVMNDKGNVHNTTQTEPIGIEMRVTAFAFNRADALNNMTFYKYELVNKGGNRYTDFYFGIWSDPDLGDSGDDYIGSDTTRGIGYVWNGDDFDGTSVGYGDLPPATGYDFFQGPLVNNDGVDNDNDGEVDEDNERLSMTNFNYFNNNPGAPDGDPETGTEYYNYLTGFWKDGERFTFGGRGRGFSEEPTNFVYPGEVSNGCAAPGDCFWSEEDTDGAGSRNQPSDRRFVMSTGPFILDPGATQEIIFGVVWAQGTNRFDSVRKMKADDALAQQAFDINFQLPSAPDAPRVEVSELDETIVISWGYRPSDNNYLNSYDVENPFLAVVEEADDKTYTFEGYEVYQFTSPTDQTGKVIATFDVPNGITRVSDVTDAGIVPNIAEVVVSGGDSGVKQSLSISNLTNYTDYYFGLQAYAYNQYSAPKIVKSSINRFTVRPSKSLARGGGTVVNLENQGAEFTEANGTVTKEGKGGGFVSAEVVDPGSVTGHTYRAEFYEEVLDPGDEDHAATVATNYRLVDANSGDVLFNGADAFEAYGGVAPQGSDLFVVDGLSWSISGPAPSWLDIDGEGTPAFIQVSGPNGFDDACGPNAGSTFGCAEVGGNFMYPSFSGTREVLMYQTAGDHTAGSEATLGNYAPNDFEIRFTETGSYGYHPFTSGAANWIPYEVWDIGPTGPFGVNDPSDDVQMIGNTFSDSGDECFWGYSDEVPDPFGLGWPGTDRIYAYYATPSYADWEAAVKPIVDATDNLCATNEAGEVDAASAHVDFGRGRPIQRESFFGDPSHPDFRPEGPAIGNVFRMLTTKPNLPGDVFTINTAGYEAQVGDADAAEDAVDLISVVPNPYKGASAYETTNLIDAARFTNLPEKATIRIFTLSGALIKTIFKSGPETSIDWDLTTDEDLPIASGMYLIHVETDFGEKIIKYGVIKKESRLDLF